MSRNKLKIAKKAFCLLFAFLLSINSFAAIVSDNDGSAFVTKSEFEALKKDFADQIDNYNDSIDKKIDGSIANYLAGLNLAKESVERFPVCGGEKLLVVNTKNVNDLQFGKVGVDWKINITMIYNLNLKRLFNGSCGIVSMTREGDDNYEAFVIDNSTEKFKYYGDKLKIDTQANFSQIKAVSCGNAAAETEEQLAAVALRWGANPYGGATHGETETVRAAGSVDWSDYYGSNTFFAIYGTGINWGTLYYGSEPSRHIIRNNISTVSIKNDKIKWIIDDSDAASQVWVKDPEKRVSSLSLKEEPNYVTTNRRKTFPSDAGVTGMVSISSTNYDTLNDEPIYPQRYSNLNGEFPITWSDSGTYNNMTYPASGQSTPWDEFHLVTNSKTSSNIINENFTTTFLNDYATYGFHGYITEGIPIGIFKANTSVRFSLDTTGWGRNCNIGVSTTPFNTDNIANMTANPHLELSIDGVKQSRAVGVFAQGKHTIEIKNIDAQPLFIKLAFPRGSTPRVRKVLTWPSTYILIDEN